jgi:hypothetical protein
MVIPRLSLICAVLGLVFGTLAQAAPVQFVNSLDALRSLNAPVRDECVMTLGYYSPGDGGGSTFYWVSGSTAADDGATVITPNSNAQRGRWRRVPEVFVNVRAYGAKGDGSTPDGDRIQLAINHANAAGGGVVFFPAGNYVYGHLVLDNLARVRLVGVGGLAISGRSGQCQLLCVGTEPGPCISMQSCLSIVFENLQFDRRQDPEFSPTLVAFGRKHPTDQVSMDCSFVNCAFYGSPISARFIDVSDLIDSSFRGCSFNGAKTAIELVSGSANAILIQSCEFVGQGESSLKNAGEAWTVQACNFESLDGGPGNPTNGPAGAYIGSSCTGCSSWALTFAGCWFGDVGRGGTWIKTGNANGLAIINNRFGHATPPGPYGCIQATGDLQAVTIIGNRLEAERAIDLGGARCDGVFIAGNYLDRIAFDQPKHAMTLLANYGIANFIDQVALECSTLGGSAPSGSPNGKIAIRDERGRVLGLLPVYEMANPICAP